MRQLIRLNDDLSRQALCDALADRGIACRVDNAGMHALLPLPDVMDMRVFVGEGDWVEAQQVLRDLGLAEQA